MDQQTPRFDFSGRTLIVTGGTTGIGAAICRAAGRAGANVVATTSGNEKATHELVAEIECTGGKAVAVKAEICHPAETKRLIKIAVDTFGRLDVMVNNAGTVPRKSILDSDEEDSDAVIGTNLKGRFFGCKYTAEQSISQGATPDDPGVVINMSSVHEFWPMPGNNAYCVAKGWARDAVQKCRCGTRQPRCQGRQYCSRCR